ncbi:Maintenance of ploidy protein mob2 [Sporothrix stenoceras]
MALSAKPKTVEIGDWMAHQVVEHYRLLWNFVRVVYEKESDGKSICNPTTCPTMSAGRSLEPTEIPAHEYMSLMQRWISGKIDDATLFPTDPSTVSFAPNAALVSAAVLSISDSEDWVGWRSGFSKEFASTCKTIFLQMFRVYAHLYWSHFEDPFYHLNLEKQLNSCFSHFLLTATSLDMLRAEDLEPVQLLIDLWAANGTFPPESKAYSLAHVKSGETLMRCGLEAL